jgi:hypothetical protein
MAKRDYVQLWTDLAQSPKFGRLTAHQRGVWVTLLVNCGLRNDPSFTRDQAKYWLRELTNVERALDALIEQRWLDPDPDSDLLVLHDWRDHQPTYRGPSDDPEAKRARRQNQTERERATRANRAIEERRGEDRKGEEPTRAHAREAGLASSSDPLDDGESLPTTLRGLYVLANGSRQPTPKVNDWLRELVRDHTERKAHFAFLTEWRADQNMRTVLGRTARRLEREAQDKAEQYTKAEADRRQREEAELQATIAAATPEQRERAAEVRAAIAGFSDAHAMNGGHDDKREQQRAAILLWKERGSMADEHDQAIYAAKSYLRKFKEGATDVPRPA